MSYEQFVYEVFRDHHDCLGMDSEEIEDLIEDNDFSAIERFLVKAGYDLGNMYEHVNV